MTSARFSVGVSGRGPLADAFIDLMKHQFSGARIYDRHREATRDVSNLAIPPHPEVADIEVFFGVTGARTTITLRSRKGHRHFRCAPEIFLQMPQEMTRLITRVAKCVPELL